MKVLLNYDYAEKSKDSEEERPGLKKKLSRRVFAITPAPFSSVPVAAEDDDDNENQDGDDDDDDEDKFDDDEEDDAGDYDGGDDGEEDFLGEDDGWFLSICILSHCKGYAFWLYE